MAEPLQEQDLDIAECPAVQDDDLGVLALGSSGDATLTILEPLKASGRLLLELELRTLSFVMDLSDSMVLLHAMKAIEDVASKRVRPTEVVLGKFGNLTATLAAFDSELVLEIGSTQKKNLKLLLRDADRNDFCLALTQVADELAQAWNEPAINHDQPNPNQN